MTDREEWYYIRNGGSVGPESTSRLLELLDEGAVARRTLVWRQTATDWQPLESALGLTDVVPPALPGGPPEMPPIPTASAPPVETRALPDSYLDFTPHPWRRYFARMLDTTVGASAVMFTVGVLLSAIDQDASKGFVDFINKSENRALSTIFSAASATLPNALLIGFTGSSLGKWIFGVSVTHLDSRPIGFQLALRREAMILWRGLGIGIPLISLFTLTSAFKTLQEQKKTSWDKELLLKVVHRPDSNKQTALNLAGVALWLAVFAALIAMQ